MRKIRSKLLKSLFFSLLLWGSVPSGTLAYANSPRALQQQQIKKVSGVVTDINDEPLIGVSIVIQGTQTGVITDFNGRFTINTTSPKNVLSFSYIGFSTKNIKVGKIKDSTNLKIVLKEDSKMLNEVVVVGYGTQKKISSTASVVSVNNKQLLQAPTSSVANSLSGRLTGLTAIQESGMPGGDAPILRVRGITTLSTGYESAPLVLVDGIERAFDQLDPNEIESISILKDASSTAVFGVRGANGVIIVTTRHGSSGKPKVSWSSNVSIQAPINVPDMLTSGEYSELYNQALYNDGQAAKFAQSSIDAYYTQSNPVLFPSVDWFDYMLKDFSVKHQHNINISGGTEKVKYFISLGFLNQGGLWKQIPTSFDNSTSYNRYNFRSNIDYKLTKSTTFKIGLGGIIEQRHRPKTNKASVEKYFGYVYTCPPNSSGGMSQGKVTSYNENVVGASRDPFTEMALYGFTENRKSTVNLDLQLQQKLDVITKGLSVKTTFAYDSYYSYNQTYKASVPLFHVSSALDDIDGDGVEDPYIKYEQSYDDGPMSRSYSFGKNRKMYFSASVNYNRTFNEYHTVTGLILYNQNKEWYPENIGMNYIPHAYIGLVGRLTYDYAHRYLAELNVGYNGSENFPKGKRYGLFPAVSVGYVLSEAPFMQSMKENNILDFCKFKASFGMVGNDKVGSGYRFLYMPGTYSWGGQVYFGQDPQTYGGAKEGKIGNENVTWEVAYKQNYGMESKWLNNRLTANFDYYIERRSDILTTYKTIPAHVAAAFQPGNIGVVHSHGFECKVGWRDKIKELNYHVSSNFSFNRNKIIEFDEVKQPEAWLNKTGNRVGQYYGLICTGIFNEPEQLTDPNLPIYPYGDPQLGDLMYKDYNSDGLIDYKDVVPIGYSHFPELTFGVDLGLDYKGWAISALFQGADHVSNYYSSVVRQPFLNNASIFESQRGSWTPELGEKASFPRLNSVNSSNNYAPLGNVSSSYWLKDASYIRLKSVQLSYSFKSVRMKNLLGVNNVKLYVSGNNLVTWSSLDLFDPESTPGGPFKYPQLTTYSAGFNLQF